MKNSLRSRLSLFSNRLPMAARMLKTLAMLLIF